MRKGLLAKLIASLLGVLAICVTGAAGPTWTKAQVEGFTVYSTVGKGKTRRAIREFVDARAVLHMVFPRQAARPRAPIQVLVTRDADLREDFAPTYFGKAKDVGGFFTSTSEGPLLVVNASVGSEFMDTISLHEYVHLLLEEPGVSYPLWMEEGMADLFSTGRRKGKSSVVLGKAGEHRLYSVQRQPLIPLEELFLVSKISPVYNDTKHQQSLFYAQSWALSHFLLFGENNFPEGAYWKLVNHAAQGGVVNEAAIQQYLGVNYKELEKQLIRYCRSGKFRTYTYEIENTVDKSPVDFEKLNDIEIEALKAFVKVHVRSLSEARPHVEALAKDGSQVEAALLARAYYAQQRGNLRQTAELLKAAIDNGSNSPYVYLNYATSVLRSETRSASFRKRSLSRASTLALLEQLFKARELGGPFDAKLYHRIGEVWLSSLYEPREEHFAVLAEGLEHFPWDHRIGYYIALFLEDKQRYDEAQVLCDRFFNNALRGPLRMEIESLSQRLQAKLGEVE